MDDKTRRVSGNREEMTGRGEETARNLDAAEAATTPPRPTPTRTASSSARRSNSVPRRPAATPAADEGLDRETDARTRELQAEIADTREELSETIEAIQERLKPGNIVSNATETLKEKAREGVRGLTGSTGERASGMMRDSQRTARGVVENVKQNPLPALMIGAGVAWLLMDRSRQERGRHADPDQRGWSSSPGRRPYGAYGASFDDDEVEYSDVDYQADRYETSGVGVASNVPGRVADMVSGARERLQRTTRGTTNGVGRLMRDNPLLVGAAAVLVGAAVGAAVPETERENQLMGETRDTVVGQAQEMAQTAASTVKEVASTIPDQVTDAVSRR